MMNGAWGQWIDCLKIYLKANDWDSVNDDAKAFYGKVKPAGDYKICRPDEQIDVL